MTQEEFFKRYTYDIDNDRIGGGGFGTVYKAKDNTLHKEVAIKVSQVLVKTTEDGGKKTFSLKNEVEALSHIPEHPNIANYEKDKLFSFKTQQGNFDYAVMQYYPDGNLGNAIKQGLTAEQKEDIATQLLEGIDFLHQHNVVHRDLKPANILIAKDGERIIPLITDFGLSKAVDFSDGSMFDNSYNAGTPKYSSPEQLQGKKIRLNTDLWSYGAILYELFTGVQLFSAGSGAANTAQADMEIYNKIVNGNVQSLGKMPETWRKVAERCLVVDPTKRAKDAAELFAIVKGDDDETEMGDSGSVGVGASASKRTEQVSSNSGKPSSPSSQGMKLSNGTRGSKTPLKPNDKPINKKGLWIGLGIAAVVALLVLLLKPKPTPTPTDPDTQAYEACQTVADYRSYLSDYGRNALHYTDAKAFIDQYVTDSVIRVQDSLDLVQAQPLTQQEAKNDVMLISEVSKKEMEDYKKCTTIAACNSYLKTYPQGHYVNQVQDRKMELEIKAQQQPQQQVQQQTQPSSNGEFSVSFDHKVYFAKGNLQYQASMKMWRIAPNPWDIIGEANKNISSTYNGWIDLFGWGTGDDPTKASEVNADYFEFTDWGPQYKNGWRTLTKDEWVYVFDKRCTSSNIRYAKAVVNGINGVILLPDDWNKNTYNLNRANKGDASYGSNNISAVIWNSIFSPSGAIFLPASGSRRGNSVRYVGNGSGYWSTSTYASNLAYGLHFDNSSLRPKYDYYYDRFDGHSVRLVRSAQN